MSDKSNELKEKIRNLVSQAVESDVALRAEHQIGDKFRFIRDRLSALKKYVDDSLQSIKVETEQKKVELAEDEMFVYVYLFNAQGIILETWHKMLNPDVFYEYSVNRPIYGDIEHIKSFMRSRSNKAQHAYLTVAIKKEHVLKNIEPAKDAVGNPVVKVKEGALSLSGLHAFTHNDQNYWVNAEGRLVKKT